MNAPSLSSTSLWPSIVSVGRLGIGSVERVSEMLTLFFVVLIPSGIFDYGIRLDAFNGEVLKDFVPASCL